MLFLLIVMAHLATVAHSARATVAPSCSAVVAAGLFGTTAETPSRSRAINTSMAPAACAGDGRLGVLVPVSIGGRA